MSYLFGALLFIVGSFIGLRFADFDQSFRWLPLIGHRSLITHSFLMPLLLVYAFRKNTEPPTRLFLLGICLATGVHLGFDLFPRYWTGYARIHTPFYGWTSPLFSQIWLLIGMLVSFFLGCRLLRNMGEFFIGFFGLMVTYGVCAAAQPRSSFFALLVLLITAPLMFLLARPSYKPRN